MLSGQEVSNFLLDKDVKLLFKKSSSTKYIYKILFFTVGILRITHLFISQYFSYDHKIDLEFDHIIGITQHGYSENLKYRHKNYYKYFHKNRKIKFHLVDEYNKKDFTCIQKISFFNLYKELKLNVNKSSIFLSKISDFKLIKLIFFSALKTIAIFSYISLCFKDLKKLNGNLKFFSGGSELVANAAINQGVKTYLLKHGLMSKTSRFCFLNYEHVYVYSEDDKKYINTFLPITKVSVFRQDMVKTHTNKVILFFTYRDIGNLNLLKEIKDFFNNQKMDLVFKSHPTMYRNEQSIIIKELDIKEVDSSLDGAEAIKELCPSFCIGWTSTALCESLYSGVIPICTQHESEKEALLESAIIYPFEQRTLNWFKDKPTILKLINGEVQYDEVRKGLLIN